MRSGLVSTCACALIVDPVPAATNNIVAAFAYQTSDAATFTPTWDTSTLGASLIAGQYFPSGGVGTGNFASNAGDGGLSVLTDGSFGVLTTDGTHPAFATCGPSAGQSVTYTLPASALGYDITNILIAGGWNDGGRNTQEYTVLYSTVDNPTTFIPLVAPPAIVHRRPACPSSAAPSHRRPAASLATFTRLWWTSPPRLLVPNGYSGYSEISVFGSPSATDTLPITVTAVNQNTSTPDWVVEQNSLIEGRLPSRVGAGDFTGAFTNAAAGGLPVLTDGTFGPYGLGNTNLAICGTNGAGSSVTFISPTGWDLTNIVVYSLWNDYGQDGQFYNLSYSTLSDPTTFIPLTSVSYNPDVPTDGTASGNRVAISPVPGQTMLASNVYAVKFDFTPQGSQDFGWSGYSEIVLQGSNLAQVTIATVNPPTISGGNLIMTGTGGTPNYSYTVMTTTNLLTPLAGWTVSTNGVTDGTGAFSTAIPVSAAPGGSFYQLRMP